PIAAPPRPDAAEGRAGAASGVGPAAADGAVLSRTLLPAPRAPPPPWSPGAHRPGSAGCCRRSGTDKDPSHDYTKAGTYTVKLTSSGGTCSGSDDEIKTSYIVINGAPMAKDTFRCGPGEITLEATGAGTIKWYDSQSLTTLLSTGNSFTTPSLTTTTTYYITSTSPGVGITGGPADLSIGANGIFDNSTDRYLIFDVLSNTTLKTVDVKADVAGSRKIELRNSSGTVITSANVNVPAGVSTVTLNFPLTTGTAYQLGINGTANLYRNSAGATFPYTIGSAVKITGTNYTDAGYYYYFYKWVLEGEPCVSDPVPVIAKIEICTGVDDIDGNAGIEAYPNPSSNLLNIKATENINAVYVVDMLGKVVMTDNTSKKSTVQLNISELPAGLYFVRINTANAQKLIKVIKE
ncbi:MAG TPA: T9SS type A sorting domain-containing protein, partial [Bacteroidia bacterium]|nr:T9SS type A sorting domain-containing protein [Bacteroidia bacterium]